MTRVTANGTRSSTIWLALTVLVLLALAVRLAIILFSFEQLFVPGYELFPMGVLANEILHGLPSISVFEFHDTHSGGQILSALVSALTFAVCGASYASLKLVPVLFALGTLIVTFLFVERRFGLGAALFSGLMLAVGPASYVDYSAANFGNHSEVLFFIALSLAPLFSYLVDGRRDFRTAFLFGLTTGLAVWYSLSSLLITVLYLGLWVAVEGLFFLRRSFLAWLAGAFLGTLPMTWVMLAYDAPQASWMEEKFAGRGVDLAAVPGRFWEFWSDLVPRTPCFYDFLFLSGRWLDRVLAAIWLLAALFMVVRAFPTIIWFVRRLVPPYRGVEVRDRGVVVILVLYPLALACAYALSNFKIGNWGQRSWGGFRYMLTLVYVLHLLLVYAFVELRALRLRRLAVVFAAITVLVGLLGNSGHPFTTDSWRQALKNDGFYYRQMGRVFLLPRYADKKSVGEALAAQTPRWRFECYQGIGIYESLTRLRTDARREKAGEFAIEAITGPFPAEYRPFIAQGIGMHVGFLSNSSYGSDWAQRHGREVVFSHGGADAPWLVQGLFQLPELVEMKRNGGKVKANQGLLRKVPERLRTFGYQGHGMFVGSLLWRGIDGEQQYVAEAVAHVEGLGKKNWKAAFYVGLGGSCLDYWSDPEHHDELIEATVPRPQRKHVYVGIGWMTDFYLELDPAALPRLATLPPAYYQQLTRGLAWRTNNAIGAAPATR